MSGFSFHAYLLDAIGWPIAGGQVITGQIVVAALIGLAWVFMSFWFEPMFSLGSAAWLILTVACVLLAGIVGFRSSIRPYLAKVPPVTGIISSVIIGIVLGSIIGGVVVLHIWVGDDDISPEAQVRKRLWESGIGWHYSEYLDRAQRGELDIVRQFWNGGMLVDSSNQSGETILHKAARNGHLDILKEAIERGANINTEMVGGGTPLYEAIYPGHEHIVRELIERDAELNHRTAISNERGGCTALLIAAVRGHVGVVRLLVDAGARIDIQNASGITPLMAAAFNNYPEIVSF